MRDEQCKLSYEFCLIRLWLALYCYSAMSDESNSSVTLSAYFQVYMTLSVELALSTPEC